jgi:hypothetical protein
MNPLDMTIETETGGEPLNDLHLTICGVFVVDQLPIGARAAFKREYSWELWHLMDYRGQTLRRACKEAEIRSAYDQRFKSFMKTLNELFDVGAIAVKDDRIILRRELPSPLEWLARCAE